MEKPYFSPPHSLHSNALSSVVRILRILRTRRLVQSSKYKNRTQSTQHNIATTTAATSRDLLCVIVCVCAVCIQTAPPNSRMTDTQQQPNKCTKSGDNRRAF